MHELSEVVDVTTKVVIEMKMVVEIFFWKMFIQNLNNKLSWSIHARPICTIIEIASNIGLIRNCEFLQTQNRLHYWIFRIV